MGRYSIKELEQLSGIKAHTIRIWEKRHKIIEPSRTPTNIRYYSDDDLKKIINISLLNNNGIKISRLVSLSNEELGKKVIELSAQRDDTQVYIDQMILSMIDLQEQQFESLLSMLIMKLGFEQTITTIVYPFLEKVGILWHTGVINPAQEHFISQLIRQKILVAIDALPFVQPSAASVVLFLPEHELHEIGLLFYHYVLKKAGFKTYYLGQTVPYADVKFVCELHGPAHIVTSITTFQSTAHLQRYVDTLCQDFPTSGILIAGGALKKVNITLQTNGKIFEGVAGLKSLLKIA